MGILNQAQQLGKMGGNINKLRKIQNDMKKMNAAGRSKSGNTSALVNGLRRTEIIEFDEDFFSNAKKEEIEKEAKEAVNDALDEMDRLQQENTDLTDILKAFGAAA